MDIPKRLYMSVSTLSYVDVPTHLHTFVLERLGRSETPSDNCFYMATEYLILLVSQL